MTSFGYDPIPAAEKIFEILKASRTPLGLVDTVFEHTKQLIREKTILSPDSTGGA